MDLASYTGNDPRVILILEVNEFWNIGSEKFWEAFEYSKFSLLCLKYGSFHRQHFLEL